MAFKMASSSFPVFLQQSLPSLPCSGSQCIFLWSLSQFLLGPSWVSVTCNQGVLTDTFHSNCCEDSMGLCNQARSRPPVNGEGGWGLP